MYGWMPRQTRSPEHHRVGGKLYLLKKACNTACNAAVYPALRYYAIRLKPLNHKHLSQHCTPKSLYKQPHKHQQTTTHPTTRYNLKLRNHARTDTHITKKNKYLKQTPREALKPINKHTKMLCIKNPFIILPWAVYSYIRQGYISVRLNFCSCKAQPLNSRLSQATARPSRAKGCRKLLAKGGHGTQGLGFKVGGLRV